MKLPGCVLGPQLIYWGKYYYNVSHYPVLLTLDPRLGYLGECA